MDQPTAAAAAVGATPPTGPGDNLGPMEIIWRSCHFLTIVDRHRWKARVLVAEGETPTLSLPAALLYDAPAREVVYGWALADLCRQRVGHSGLTHAALHYGQPVCAPLLGCDD